MYTSSSRRETTLFMAKLAVFGLLVTAMQLLAGPAVTSRMISPEFHLLFAHCDAPSPVVYFGDSVVCSIEQRDTDRRSLVEMTQALVEQPVTMLAHPAFSQRVFTAFTRRMARRHVLGNVEAVFLPVNPRSFSPAWDMRPEWQFERLLFLLRHDGVFERAFFHPMATFRCASLASVSTRAFLDTPVIVAGEQAMIIGDIESLCHSGDRETRLTAEFAGYYMHDLDNNHRSFRALLDMIDQFHHTGVTPLVYITPVDREEGSRRHGVAFDRQLDRNIGVIREALAKRQVVLHDLSHTMPSSRFTYYERVNEHLDDIGRQLVAEQLAEIYRQIAKQ